MGDFSLTAKVMLQERVRELSAAHVEEPRKCISPNLEDFPMLQEYTDLFGEISSLPPKRDINFSINLMHGVALVSKTPYRISTPKLKELQMRSVPDPEPFVIVHIGW
jgi:hypothetical protein